MSEHAVLAPSSAARWMQCPGSVTMSELYPQQAEDDPKALEGVLAHAVCAAALTGAPIPDGATEEMLEGADLWADAINPVVRPRELPLLIESRVECPNVHPENWGTPDAWSIDRASKIIYVWDYKFGHRYVEAFENWQLLDYAAGILHVAGLTTEDLAQFTIHLTVVQPRNFHKDGPVRMWIVSVPDFMGYVLRLKLGAQAALQPHAPTYTGPECLDCPARHACPAQQAATYSAVEIAGQSIPFDLPPEALGRELQIVTDAIDTLKARQRGLENETLGRIKQGVNVPGWMTEQGLGRERWARPVEEVVALGVMMGIDVSKASAVTPKQAIKAGLPAEMVREYAETPIGEVKLVPSKLSRIFKGA